MYRFFLALLLWPCCAAYAQNSRKDTTNYNVHIKIPSAWIEKVRHFRYDRRDPQLLQEFKKLIDPKFWDTNDGRKNDSEEGCVFNPMFVNLDGAVTDELICFLGWDDTHPYLTVFKKIKGGWYLLYLEGIDTFYEVPPVLVAGGFSKNKVFYFSHVDDHGSGIYVSNYSFYKLINNRVYKCLSIVDDAHIYGWGLFLNQKVKTSFQFGGIRDDINVSYIYNFFPGAVREGDCPWCSNEDIPLVSGDNNIFYEWDDKRKKYKLSPLADNDPDNLTAQKIACFGDFGNDKLFVKAFRKEIDEKMKEGTPEQKKLLKQYLALVEKNGKALTEELEEKSSTGQTKFYGPKH